VHAEVGDDLAPLLDRADAALGAVGDEADRFVAPFVTQGVEGVLERARHTVVVLGVTKTNPSKESIFSLHRRTRSSSYCFWAAPGTVAEVRSGTSKVFRSTSS